MATNSQHSASDKSERAADRSNRSTPLDTRRKNFSFEETCFLMHHANQCTDFEELQEMFNLQFDTNRSIDSIEMTLHKYDDEEFFMFTEAAEEYRRWYTERPTDPVNPIRLLACRAMPIEHLAYHHKRGMDLADLKDSSNSMFPTTARDSQQIVAQLNHFQQNNHPLTSVSNFSVRYPWHHEYKPFTGIPATKAPSAGQASPVTPKALAGQRLDRDRKKSDDYSNNQAAIARQRHFIKYILHTCIPTPQL